MCHKLDKYLYIDIYKLFMSNIVQNVWNFLDHNPCIKKNMENGLINTRALAKFLIHKKMTDATLDAVIGAIRRYPLSKHTETSTTANMMLKKIINLSTRSKLAEIYLTKDDEIQKIIPKLFDIIHYVQGDVLRIIQANKSIRLLIDNKNLVELLELFPKHKILDVDKNLAEINIHIHPEMQNTPGILAEISNELAINNINIVEVMTCPPEMLFFVRDDVLVKAYNVIHELCKPKNIS